jgi:hypothetical protein
MDRRDMIQDLYRKLEEVEDQLRPFATPRSADDPHQMSQADLDRYDALIKRRAELVADLAKLEG